MKSILQLIRKFNEWREVGELQAELRQLTYWRERGDHRAPRVIARLVALGHPPHPSMLPKSRFEDRHPKIVAEMRRIQALHDGFDNDGLPGQWNRPVEGDRREAA